ncbi:MAG TPA: protein-disulfide reductase DsbD N-terminal domain-containing protein [Candidatus Acidoferrales bacterium]|nr:protein-disulfide reductase DsbD N-terminal domain-containing protein [Candidatus Acidoferrales bacterium]
MKTLICAALATLVLAAAPPEPVSWKLGNPAAKPVKAGARFSVRLTAVIQPGWHLYSLKPVPEGPVPTRIWIDGGQPFSLAGAIQAPDPVAMQDPTLDLEVEFYEGETPFTLPVKAVSGTAGPQTLTVSVSYQTCNDKLCLPPKTVKLQLALTVQ